jgi:Family of unknown function (DUF6518)
MSNTLQDLHPSTSHSLGWPWVVLAGVCLGVIGVVADQAGFSFWSDHQSIPVAVGYMLLTIIGNAAGFWALSAVLIAALSGAGLAKAMLRSTAFLGLAVVAYYTANLIVGARSLADQVGQATLRWLLVVVVIGPLAGLIAVWLRSPRTGQATVAVAGVIGLLFADLFLITRVAGVEYPAASVTIVVIYGLAVGIPTWLAVRRVKPFLIGSGLAILLGGAFVGVGPIILWLQHG